jgi:hypothetical protein
MLTDKDLLTNKRVFAGEIRLPENVVQVWIDGIGSDASLQFSMVDANGSAAPLFSIPAKDASFLKLIIGNAAAFIREREEHSRNG